MTWHASLRSYLDTSYLWLWWIGIWKHPLWSGLTSILSQKWVFLIFPQISESLDTILGHLQNIQCRSSVFCLLLGKRLHEAFVSSSEVCVSLPIHASSDYLLNTNSVLTLALFTYKHAETKVFRPLSEPFNLLVGVIKSQPCPRIQVQMDNKQSCTVCSRLHVIIVPL